MAIRRSSRKRQRLQVQIGLLVDRPSRRLIAAPLFFYPIFLMKLLCFALFACAFNLLLGYTGLLSFGHADLLRRRRLFHRPCGEGVGRDPRARHPHRRRGSGAFSAWSSGFFAIRRQGIYFAMITLALVADVLLLLPAGARSPHGEDGIQSVPRGHLFGFIDLDQPTNMYYFVLAGLPDRHGRSSGASSTRPSA